MTCTNCGRDVSVHACNCIPLDFWSHPEVTRALHLEDARALVILLARYTELRQEEIGRITGLSQPMVSQVVSGYRQLSRPDKKRIVLEGIKAHAADRPATPYLSPSVIAPVRKLVDVYDTPEDGPVRPMAELRSAASAVVAWRLDSQYARLLDELPALIPELTRALLMSSGQQHTEAARMLAQTYRSADAIAAKYGMYDLSGRLIQVMRWAADQADDEATSAAADYVRAETFFAVNERQHFEAGRRMLEKAATQVNPSTSLRAAAAFGALHMRAAVMSARAKHRDRASEHLAEARTHAQRVHEGVYDGTAFGPASLRIHRVTLALDMEAPDDALAAAAGWTPPSDLPAERRSHFYVDIARAQFQCGRSELAVDSLGTALKIAPEHIRVHPQVRQVVRTIAREGGPAAVAAQDFADAALIDLAG